MLNVEPSYPWMDQNMNATTIIYNRVPKCASGYINTIIAALATRNNFHFHTSSTYMQHNLDPKQQVYIIRTWERINAPDVH